MRIVHLYTDWVERMSKSMRRLMVIAFLVLGICVDLNAHNVGNAITWNREISRIIYQRCASCHHDGGTAFSLMRYPDVQPRAVDIKDAVLSRRMPPWGAVKGFGDFRNDQGLTQAELELITDWVDSDTPKGNNPNTLPKEPKFDKPATFKIPKNAIRVSGDFTLTNDVTLDGLFPEEVPSGVSTRIVAALPDGQTQPLLWLYEYKDTYRHPFLFRQSLDLPAGTIIRGVPREARITLLPGKKNRSAGGAGRN
jgi:mono/diheme cytochrome c family protein